VKDFLRKVGLTVMACIALFGINEVSAPAAEQPLDLTLLSRSPHLAHQSSQSLNAEQQRWLATKTQLVVGVSQPQYPPFTVINNKSELEGITADYIGLLSVILDKPIHVQVFASQKAAYEALSSGKIDLLGAVTQFERRNERIALTEPYATEQAILATRNNANRTLSRDLDGENIAMAVGYLPPDWVQQQYPHANVQTYPSYQQAIGAVAFGDADVFLGDLYPINRNFLNNIRVVGFADFPARNISFGVRPDNHLLREAIDIALAEVSNEERLNILQRWHVGRSASVLNQQIFQLSDEEKRWIAQHKKVRVAAIDGFAPLTFTDDDGNYRGITIDVLSQIRLRTGLDFEIKSASNVEEMLAMLKNGQADMIGALTPSPERKQGINFSRAYFTSAFVMVVRQQGDAPRNLSDMDNKKVAVITGTRIADTIRSQYPEINVVDAANAIDALAMLNRGQVDAAINTLANSEYQIARYYRNRMRISATLGESPAFLSFAIPQQSLELQRIVDKVMLSIPPDEMDVIGNLWRPNNMVASDNFWRENRSLIVIGGAFSAALILVSLVWAIWLRRQIRIKTRVQRALNDQLEFMHDMINGTPNATYIRDASGRLTQCNDIYLQDLGRTREQVINHSLLENHLFEDEQQTQNYIQDFYRVLSTGNPIFKDRTFSHIVGRQQRTIFHWILPYRDAGGTVKGVIGGWLDISERRLLLEALSEAKEQAEAASKAKTQFLSTMSHEIRTPLNAVIGMLELARKAAEKNRVDYQALEVASASANDLVELLGDILDIARIESGKLTLQPERANVQQLCKSVIRVFEGLAEQKALNLTLSIEPSSGEDVLIDPLRFKQILSNLVSNAIKFTAEGGVMVDLRLRRQAQWEIVMTITDSGKGISEEDQTKLFAPFSQVGDRGEQTLRGTGLGLIICKTLCEKMGGSIALRSQPGKGTQIEVVLYADALTQSEGQIVTDTAAVSDRPAAALRILIVDDFKANRLLLTRQLNFLGHHVLEAEEGEQALALWQQHPVDVVITDCRMPVMDGYQLAQAIRAQERQRELPGCTILGFTANAQPEERIRCHEAGMDGCMFKPSTLEDLQRWLGNVPRHADTSLSEDAGAYNEAIMQLAGGDSALVSELMQEINASYQQDILALTAALAADDHPTLRELAHKIKGSARMTGAAELVAECVDLEIACEPETPQRKEVAAAGRALLAGLRRALKSESQQ